MAKKRNPKTEMEKAIAQDMRLWCERFPNATPRRKLKQFDAIADAHYNLRKRLLKSQRRKREESGVGSQGSPVC